MFGQTTAVLVSFPTFFTSQVATTCTLAVALGQTRALAGTPCPRLGARLLVLGHGREGGTVGEGFPLAVAAGTEGSRRAVAVGRHAGAHGRVE